MLVQPKVSVASEQLTLIVPQGSVWQQAPKQKQPHQIQKSYKKRIEKYLDTLSEEEKTVLLSSLKSARTSGNETERAKLTRDLNYKIRKANGFSFFHSGTIFKVDNDIDIDETGSDKKKYKWNQKTYMGHCFIVILLTFTVLGQGIALVFKEESVSGKDAVPDIITPRTIIPERCADHEKLIGDGVCDEASNNPLCLYDGGDCCLERKDDSLCRDCTCKTRILPDFMRKEMANRGNITESAIYYPFEYSSQKVLMSIDKVHTEETCSMICLDTVSTEWIFDTMTGLCTCFEDYQVNACSSTNETVSLSYLYLRKEMACDKACGSGHHLNWEFVAVWGIEVNYTGCVDIFGRAHGQGTGVTKDHAGALQLFVGTWFKGGLPNATNLAVAMSNPDNVLE